MAAKTEVAFIEEAHRLVVSRGRKRGRGEKKRMPDKDPSAPMRQGNKHSHPQSHKVIFMVSFVYFIKNYERSLKIPRTRKCVVKEVEMLLNTLNASIKSPVCTPKT